MRLFRLFTILIVSWLLLISGITASAATMYTVKRGDSLSSIAEKFYQDQYKWAYIYRANQKILRKDLGGIKPGLKLEIPSLSAVQTAGCEPTPGTKTICLVTGNEYAPFSGSDLPNGGMITEIVKTVFESMGYETKIDFWEWEYGKQAMQDGIFSATFPYLYNKQREEQGFVFSEPLYKMLIKAFVRKESNLDYKALDDFSNKTLCRPKGYYTHDIQKIMGKISLERPEKLSDCFEMLVAGKVDVVPVNEFSGDNLIYDMGIENRVKKLGKAVSIESLHLMFYKYAGDTDVLLYEFNESVKNLHKAGQLKEIIKHHKHSYYEQLKKKRSKF